MSHITVQQLKELRQRTGAGMLDCRQALEHAEGKLGVTPGATTADGRFTLEEVECIARCDEAPCLAVNWRYFGRVSNDAFDQLVVDLESGKLDEEVPPHGTLNRVRRRVAST